MKDANQHCNELVPVIEEILSRMDFSERMVFSLRQMAGMSCAETAGLLNLSETEVEETLHRAKETIADELLRSFPPKMLYEFNLIYCNAVIKNVMNRINEL